MKINYVSSTLWFNVFENHHDILSILQLELKDEFDKFNVFNPTDNLFAPIISANNDFFKTDLVFSTINLQFTMYYNSNTDINKFKDLVLKLYNILSENGVEIKHAAIFANAETVCDNALKRIAKKTINTSLISEDLIDITLKVGKKHEDLFYKIVTFLNKKQLNIPKMVDKNNNVIPIPLVPWKEAELKAEFIDVSYEINDKYSFDNVSNYATTEFYLNKMLYVFESDMEDDIQNILENGNF